MELTEAQMRRILQDAGADAVDDDAAAELAEVLENYIGYISEEADAIAREDGRKAVTKEDIVRAEN